jgi:hypothetical protein
VRIVYTALYATVVRIVYASRRGARDAEHIGPTRDEAEMEVLKAAAPRVWPLARTSSVWAWSAGGVRADG